ncbi:hypothetical protein BVRB_9g212290 [Beta vulgaris subsp. vulgaris]|nr:hypothetical protein BVRB_9g212290 [Beta vulgaris subsp. vulgaris]
MLRIKWRRIGWCWWCESACTGAGLGAGGVRARGLCLRIVFSTLARRLGGSLILVCGLSHPAVSV